MTFRRLNFGQFLLFWPDSNAYTVALILFQLMCIIEVNICTPNLQIFDLETLCERLTREPLVMFWHIEACGYKNTMEAHPCCHEACVKLD